MFFGMLLTLHFSCTALINPIRPKVPQILQKRSKMLYSSTKSVTADLNSTVKDFSESNTNQIIAIRTQSGESKTYQFLNFYEEHPEFGRILSFDSLTAKITKQNALSPLFLLIHPIETAVCTPMSHPHSGETHPNSR